MDPFLQAAIALTTKGLSEGGLPIGSVRRTPALDRDPTAQPSACGAL